MMIKAIVTDIEGTTSSISFVHDVLFPYARERMSDYLRSRRDDPQVQAQLALVAAEAGRELTLDESIALLCRWIDEDCKVAPLKTLQGYIWRQGYLDGDFSGHVYQDAYDHLKGWHDRGLALYVYSSGSVGAQKLLFGHSDFGDMTPLFSGYFDTAVGHKREADAYRNILSRIDLEAAEVLFLSDVVEELAAAAAAGMAVAWLDRDNGGNDGEYPRCRSFEDVAGLACLN